MGSEQSSNKGGNNKENEATRRELAKLVEQQKMLMKQFEESNLAANRASSVSSPPNIGVSVPSNSHLSQPSTSSEFTERQRNLYSYNQNQLQSQMNSNTGNLYPNLNEAPSNYQGTNNNYMSPGFSTSVAYHAYQNPHASFIVQRSQVGQPTAPPSDSPPGNTRPRSQLRQRSSDCDLNCKTCGKMYGERIYQCNQGHSSCDLCKTRQVPCGQCRQSLTDRRNFDLEKYVSERRVECPNSVDGCRLHFKMADLALHEKECPFKALQCPSLGGNCTWTGKPSQLSSHFNEAHESHIQGDIDKEMFMSNITMTSHTMHYISLGPFNFLLHVKISAPEARIYVAVQLIGTKHSAAKWDYEIHIYKKNEPRRKFQYVDRCSSASEPLQNIMNDTKCAVIPLEYAKTFLYGGAVAYKFFIKRDDMKENETVNTGDVRKEARAPPRRHNFKKYVKKN